MFELLMTAFGCNHVPTFFAQLVEQFANFHQIILPQREGESNLQPYVLLDFPKGLKFKEV